MAKTIDNLTLTVGVTAYEHEGCQYDALLIIVAYKKGRGFCVSWQPVKQTDYGYQTGPMPSSDPLVGGGAVVAMEAAKNSVKTLEQMRTNLEAAQEGIRAYFDARELDIVNIFLKSVAKCGYTYDFEKQVKAFINKQNNTTMATVEMNNESANVQNAQVNNNTAAIEDVNVGEVTVDSIMPVMQSVEEKKADVRCEKADVKPHPSSIEHHPSSLPLGSHGTLVVGGVPKPKKSEDKPKVQDSVPQAGKYQYVTYEVKKVNKTTKKEYTVTGSKIVGFELTDPIYLAGPAFCGAISTESVDGKTVGTLRFSHKWTPAVKDVCDLLNSGKATLEGCVAIINGAKAERSERIQERIAKREERKAKKAAAPAAKPQGTVTAGYSDQDVADMLRKVMAGGDVPENIKKLLQAA